MSFITSPGIIVPPLTAGGVAYGTGTQAKVNSAGTSGQVLLSAGAGVPAWGSGSSVLVTSFSGASTGLTPATATTGAISLAGTLAVGSGGTSLGTLTANNVILGNGASAPTFVAPSTSGNLLTSNGTTWQSTTPAASASGLTLITTLTASTSASLIFTNTSITSTYDNYLFIFNSLRAVVQNSFLYLRTSTDNGSTFATTSGNYDYSWGCLQGINSSFQIQNSQIKTGLQIGSQTLLASVASIPACSFCGMLYMLNPLQSSDQTQFVGQVSAIAQSTRQTTAFGGGSRNATEANNAIQFYFDAGDITSGTIQIFGVQK